MKIKINSRSLNVIIDKIILIVLCTYFGNSIIMFKGFHLYEINISILFLLSCIKIILIKKIKMNIYIKWYFLFYLYCLSSLLWSKNLTHSISVIRKLTFVIMFIFSIIQEIENKKSIINLIKKYIYSLIYTTFMLLLFERNFAYFGKTIGVNRNSLALAYTIGVYFIAILFSKKYISKKYLSLLPVFFTIIIISGSRKGILMLPLIGTLLLIFNAGLIKIKIIRNLFLISAGLLISIMIIISIPSLSHRIEELFQSFIGKQVLDLSINERKIFREIAFNLFKENMIIGKGLHGFSAYMEEIRYKHIAYSHNNWLELLSTLGIIGFIIYYYMYYYIFINSLKTYNKENLETYFPFVLIFVLFINEYGTVTYFTLEIQLLLFILIHISKYNIEERGINENLKKNDFR